MAKFAAKTRVPAQQTRGEIETLLTAKKATAIGVFSGTEQAAIVFEMQGRRIMFRLPLPPNITDQSRRQRWRALLLAIKAKLAAVDDGIETFEQAFLAHIVMPDGLTVGEHTHERIASAYQGGTMQPLLPPPKKDQK
jgi:hypothetical protein